MNKIFILGFNLLILATTFAQQTLPVMPSITIDAAHVQMADLLCVLIAPENLLREFAPLLKQDLEFTKQVRVTITEQSNMLTAQELQKIGQRYTFILFLTGHSELDSFNLEWRL
jgi:hypothetical protein